MYSITAGNVFVKKFKKLVLWYSISFALSVSVRVIWLAVAVCHFLSSILVTQPSLWFGFYCSLIAHGSCNGLMTLTINFNMKLLCLDCLVINFSTRSRSSQENIRLIFWLGQLEAIFIDFETSLFIR